MNNFYVDIPAPSLHGNNSEIGAKTVNIKMYYRFTSKACNMLHVICDKMLCHNMWLLLCF